VRAYLDFLQDGLRVREVATAISVRFMPQPDGPRVREVADCEVLAGLAAQDGPRCARSRIGVCYGSS
jgi:hypothetical protein